MRNRISAALAVAVAVLMISGCGTSATSETTKTGAESPDAKKIQELSKKGYNFSEIRSIMNGEQPKPRPKKKSGSTRR